MIEEAAAKLSEMKMMAALKLLDRSLEVKNLIPSVSCSNCDLLFTTNAIMKSHRKVKHSINAGDFRCKYCPYASYIKKDLERHQNIHTGNRPHICEICHRGFTQSGNLKSHVQAKHTGKSILCEKCGKLFVNLGELNSHMMAHFYVKRLVCPLCISFFLRACNFRRHMKETHNRI
jgi:uncharacterized Zn-finger protein